MLERALYPKLSHIVKDKLPKGQSMAFELKVVKDGRPFYTRQLEDHQLRALRMVGIEGVYTKLSDQSMGQKPFDSFLIRGVGYLVVYFESSKLFYFIDIRKYLDFIEVHPVKLTEDDCASLAAVVA